MTDRVVDHRLHRGPRVLGGLAALACVACCALPVLIAAGVVGTGAGVLVGWLPAVAIALAVVAVGVWWLGRRRQSCTCGGQRSGSSGCSCQTSTAALQISDHSDR